MRTKSPIRTIRRTIGLVASALCAFVASVPAAAPFTGAYSVEGFFVQSWTQNGKLILANGYDYQQTLRIFLGSAASLSPGISSDYTGSWSKKGGAYSANFSKSYAPQIKVLLAPENLKKIGYRLIDMHPLDNGVDGSVLTSLTIKSGGVKTVVKEKGAFFGTRI